MADDPPDTAAYELFQQGLAALHAGRADEAMVPLERAKRLEPDSSSINEALGTAYYKMRFYDRCVVEFELIIGRTPTDDYAHFCAGRCYDKLEQPMLARQHYRLACFFKPSREVYRNTLDRFELRQRIAADRLLDD